MSGNFDPGLAYDLTVISGIPAGDSGTGRFVAHLKARMADLAGDRIKLIARPERPALWQIRMWLRTRAYKHAVHELVRYGVLIWKFRLGVCSVILRRGQRLMLLHPQNVGYRLALRLLESRKEPPLIYLLDSSFFCIASYNHLRNENGACLRCLDMGFGQMVENGCKPFPRPDPEGVHFAPRLQHLARSGRVKVAAQNVRQAELAQRQFGLVSPPPVVGLWTQDWDEIFAGNVAPMASKAANECSWDVLFHGHGLDAKGAGWTTRLAAQCPELRFMFPFARPDWLEAPANCFFIPYSWENGLREEIGKSRYVAVPSRLWAPHGGAVGVNLAGGRGGVGVELRQAVESDWMPDADIKTAWVADFAKKKSSFVPGLLAVSMGS